MTAYRIDPAGVASVLTQTQTDAEQFGIIMTPLQGHVEAAVTATGGSGVIAGALEAFFQEQSTVFKGMNGRITAAVTGAVDATTAYVNGDLEMVNQYQQAAGAAGAMTPGATAADAMAPVPTAAGRPALR